MYVIRHKASQELMPQMKKNKGYSHWNPSNPESNPRMAMDGVPRLLHTVKQAKQVINQWYSYPNARYEGYTSYNGEDDYDIRTKEDGRKKEDLEIIEVGIEYIKVIG